MNQMRQQNPTPNQKIEPNQEIETYLQDARSSADAVKKTLVELIHSNQFNAIRASTLTRLSPFVKIAVEKSTLALNNVPGIKIGDAKEIEEDIECMKSAFIKAENDTYFIYVLKNCAESLESTWESHYKSLNMGKIKKNLGSYATGQMFNHSAKQGGRRKRNHKRTHRKRKHTHRNRK